MGSSVTVPKPANTDCTFAISAFEIRLTVTVYGLYSPNGTNHPRLSTDVDQAKRLLWPWVLLLCT